jgi:hypothetical protein
LIYVIRVPGRVEPGTGSLELEAKTEEDALEKARNLRSEGLEVQIFGPNGRRIDNVFAE